MNIQPVGAVGAAPVVYNVRKLTPLQPKINFAEEASEKIRESNGSNLRKRFDTVDFNSDEVPQDFKAINLIKKSHIPPPEPPDFSERNMRETELRETVENAELEKLTENSATVKTSSEIEEQSSASKLTPSQKQGMEEYQRIQNYSSPLNMSNARIAV